MFDFFKKKQMKANSNCTTSVSMSDVVSLVNEILMLEQTANTKLLKSKLKILDNFLSCPEGNDIVVSFPQKDSLSLCYSFLLNYVMGTESQKIKWSEMSFYCIVEHLDHQKNGRQGQAESFVLFFILLCVGRDYLKPRIQNIIDTMIVFNANTVKPLFGVVDTLNGAQNVIDQFAFIAVNGIRDMGQSAIPIMMEICNRYNGMSFFEEIIKREDLLMYDPSDIIDKMRYLRNNIRSTFK